MTTPLSNHELKILAELELQFLDAGAPARSPSAVAAPEQESKRYWSRRHALSGALLALAGVVLLAIGATSPSIAAGAAGFVLMGTGVYLAMLPAVSPRRKEAKKPAGPKPTTDTPSARTTADTGQGSRSFRGGHRDMALWSLFFWL